MYMYVIADSPQGKENKAGYNRHLHTVRAAWGGEIRQYNINFCGTEMY